MEYGFTQKLFGYFYHSSCMKQAAKQKQAGICIYYEKCKGHRQIQTHEFLLHGGIFYRLKP